MKINTTVGRLLDFLVDSEDDLSYDQARTIINELLLDESVVTEKGSCTFVRMYGVFDNITVSDAESIVVVRQGRREIEFNDFDVVCNIILK